MIMLGTIFELGIGMIVLLAVLGDLILVLRCYLGKEQKRGIRMGRRKEND